MREILLIDDDITALDIASFLFEGRGYSVTRAADGLQAIALVEKNPPDLILVDLMMPGINGMDTVREIRGRGYVEIPILAFTAADDPELHADALAAGCNKVLTKPLRAEVLLAEVAALLA